jgi:hypothetical protein
MENSSSGHSTDLFEGHRTWDTIQAIHLFFHIILTFVAPVLNYVVVWYQTSDASLQRHLLTNQMLSHVCIISIVRCFTVRIASVMWLHFGPFSSWFCDVALLAGRFFFLLVLAELALWQLIKCMYIFCPKYLLKVNDTFMAIFLTCLNILINAVFMIITHMEGFQNSELDYHICTGKDPQENINNTLHVYRLLQGSHDDQPITFRNVRNFDYVHYATPILRLLLILCAAQIWTKSLKKCGSNQSQDEEHEQDVSKETLYGAGGSLLVIGIMMLLVTPSQISISIFSQNPNLVNTGSGKIWTYTSRITIALISYCVVPTIILITNPNLRQTLANKIKNLMKISN